LGPTSGAGIEIEYQADTGKSEILSYDRDAGLYKSLKLRASKIILEESGTDIVTIDGGNVGIGTTSPKFLLSVESSSEGNMFQLYDTDGNCRQDPDASAITTTCSSDARLKTDISPAKEVLPYLLGIPIKDFTVKASGDERTGVVAQDLLADYPELVSMGDDGYYGVSEINSWKLVKAIQELNAKIEFLEERLNKSLMCEYEE
jgi:hypothetical protein